MKHRHLSLIVAAFAAAVFVTAPAMAADEDHSGEIKSVNAKKSELVVTVKDEDHTFTVAKTAKITVDGKAAKIADLKAGQSVTVTTTKDDDGKVTATKIVAKKKKE